MPASHLIHLTQTLLLHLVLTSLLLTVLLTSLVLSPLTLLLALLTSTTYSPFTGGSEHNTAPYDLVPWDMAVQRFDVGEAGPVPEKKRETRRGVGRERGPARGFDRGARRTRTMPDYYVDYR